MKGIKLLKPLRVITCLAATAFIGLSAQSAFAYGEQFWSKSSGIYTVKGKTYGTDLGYSGGYHFYRGTHSTSINYPVQTLEVTGYLYNSNTGASMGYCSNSDQPVGSSGRDGYTSCTTDVPTNGSYDLAARSYHYAYANGTALSGYSYDFVLE